MIDYETLMAILIGASGFLWCVGMLLADMDYDNKIKELWLIDQEVQNGLQQLGRVRPSERGTPEG